MDTGSIYFLYLLVSDIDYDFLVLEAPTKGGAKDTKPQPQAWSKTDARWSNLQ